ncbi:MAG TPA: MarR family transcriptional regulator [Gammaproteobacteria bacterium]|nr:MarR family transcriptional regulator [Gammaproteobacteria bacterium]
MDPIRNIGFVLKDVSRLWVRHFEQRATQLGMTLTQFKVLVYLSRNEGATQAKLAELSDTDPMTLVRIIDRMENDGWLERRPDPCDRRAHRLFLKPAADPLLDEVTHIADKARADALNGVSADERAELLTLLERIRGNLLSLLSGGAEAAGSRSGGTAA